MLGVLLAAHVADMPGGGADPAAVGIGMWPAGLVLGLLLKPLLALDCCTTRWRGWAALGPCRWTRAASSLAQIVSRDVTAHETQVRESAIESLAETSTIGGGAGVLVCAHGPARRCGLFCQHRRRDGTTRGLRGGRYWEMGWQGGRRALTTC